MGHVDKFYVSLFLWIVAQFCITGSDGLQNVKIEGPNYVRRGDTVTLTCKYDMERDTLYAVKWYYRSKEFYRFIPKEVPNTQVFRLPGIPPGIVVDESRSNDHDVVLQSVPLEISGKYKCTVSAEATFQTLFDIKELIVVEVGYGAPILSLNQDVFNPGDKITANCSIGRTSPPANITWYLGDQEINPKKVQTFSIPDANDTTIVTTMSTTTFELPESFTMLHVKCTGKLYDLYSESSIFEMQRPTTRYSIGSSDLSSLRSNSTTRGFAQDFHQAGGLLLLLSQLLVYSMLKSLQLL